jgi:formylglycine-generating enzyme required for sulfatase activity
VSWYEAIAFCLWLSDVTGDAIMLPTEQQWQRAAQGDDGRIYPWGNNWDNKRCNNSNGISKTTPVNQFEGWDRGNSYFGVVDMAGNVWEWCLTAYETGSQTLVSTDTRIMRGGAYYSVFYDNEVDIRIYNFPYSRDDSRGFRVARSYT